MDAQRFRISLVLEHFYRKLYNPGWPHTPDEYTLEMRVDIDPLRMGIVLSQPAPPPQCGSSPRQAPVVDTESDEPGTPQAESQSTEREGIFPLHASADGIWNDNYTSPEQKCILLQPDVGVDDEEKKSTSEQAAAREGFARPPKKRQQQRMKTWTTDQSEQFDPGG